MDEFKEFLSKYWGGLLGAIIALILACTIIGIIVGLILATTNLYRFVIGIVLIVCGFIAGNYLQYNKTKVKKKLKEIVDKL